MVFVSRAQGRRQGEVTRQILKGTRPQDIPIEHATPEPILDWRQLQRWRIPESALPAGSEIRFREISTWERHRATMQPASAVG
jgi:hypothetical protein